MQEIKFRAKRQDNKDWVTGSLTAFNGKCCIWVTAYTFHPVDPDTVGQYIGIKDRKGQDRMFSIK